MGIALRSKTTQHATLFHALSEPVRLEVLELLVDGEHCVCEITDALDIAQSRLSFHLKVLKDARLITDRRAGRWTYYAIVRETFDEAVETLTALRPRAVRSRSSPACCD